MRHKLFQKTDLAAAACVDGAILGWEQGLGKTLGAMTWPFLKRASRTLLVVPGGLHQQFQIDARKLYKIHIPIIKNLADLELHRINTPILPAPEKRMGKYFLISYEDLTRNGADEKASVAAGITKNRALDLNLLYRDAAIAAFDNKMLEHGEYFQGIGSTTPYGITFVWAPTLARVLSQYESLGWGFDCIVVDEAVRLQSEDAEVSLQIRQLNPRYRLLLSGTPIKNRLGSIFYLAWWAAGGSPTPTAKFPYALTDYGKFTKSHLEIDRFLTREEDRAIATNSKRETIRIEKESARVCNVHRLWRTLSPLLVRRRKSDAGEPIVMKTIQPIQVQPGTAQATVYQHHLDNRPTRNKHGALVKHITSLGMQLTNLRLAACCPDAPSLGEVNSNGNPHHRRSWSPWTPKFHATISKVVELLSIGEQIVIGSPFQHFTNCLHPLLIEAGVRAIALDGNTTPAKRGEAIEDFKRGLYSVVICGLYSMSEGYSIDGCSHLIMPGRAFAYDTNAQMEARVWRITSKRPVSIYPIITASTIDERMAKLYEEKTDTADLTLDGSLYEDTIENFDPEKLYYEALQLIKNATTDTIDETVLEATWPTLRAQLRHGQSIFEQFHPPIIGNDVTPADVTQALSCISQQLTSEQAAERLTAILRNLRKKG